MNITCSCLKVFLRIDLLEVPYDDFLWFLEESLLLGWDVQQVMVRVVLGKKEVRNGGGGHGVFWRAREKE